MQDLGRLGRPLDRLLIVDNSPASYAFHPEHAVPVTSWFDDMADTELLDLLPFFESLYNADNIFSVLADYQAQRQIRQQQSGGGAQQTAQQLQAASAEQAAQLGVPLTVPITSPPPVPPAPPPDTNNGTSNTNSSVIHSIAPPSPPSPLAQSLAAPEPQLQLQPQLNAKHSASASSTTLDTSYSERSSVGRRPSTPPESFAESTTGAPPTPTGDPAANSEAASGEQVAISEKFPFSPPPILVPLNQTPAPTPPTARGSTSLLATGAGSSRTSTSTPISGSRSSSMAMIHAQTHRLEFGDPASANAVAGQPRNSRQERASLYTQSGGGSVARNSFDSSITLSLSLKHSAPSEKRSSSPVSNKSGSAAAVTGPGVSARQGAQTLPLFLPNPNARRQDGPAIAFNSFSQPPSEVSSRAFKQSSLRSTLGKSAPPSDVGTLGKEHVALEPSSAYRSASQNCLTYGAGGVGTGSGAGVPSSHAAIASTAQGGNVKLLHGGSSSALNSNRVNLRAPAPPPAPDSSFIRHASGSSASSSSGAKFPGKRSTAGSPASLGAASAHS